METANTALISPFSLLSLLDDRRGFTLIEVLVTGMILAMIVTLSFFSINVYMNEWERGRLGNLDAIEQFRTRQLIEKALESVEEYIVTDPLAERGGDFYPYFSGTAQSIIFVTAAPVFGKSPVAAARIRLEPDKDRSRTLLVYEEAPFDRFYIHYSDAPISYSHSVALPLAAVDLKFRYFGLMKVNFKMEEGRMEEINDWQESFDGRLKQATPKKINVVNAGNLESAVIAYEVKAENRSKLIYYEVNL